MSRAASDSDNADPCTEPTQYPSSREFHRSATLHIRADRFHHAATKSITDDRFVSRCDSFDATICCTTDLLVVADAR
jgi:hypothetical protein